MKQAIFYPTVLLVAGIAVLGSCGNSPTSVPEHSPGSAISNGGNLSSTDLLSSQVLALSSSSSAPWVCVDEEGGIEDDVGACISSMVATSSAVAISSETFTSSMVASSSAVTIVSSAVATSSASASTNGKLLVTFLAASNGGRYCPSNVNATWITTSTDSWVDNLDVWGWTRIHYLYTWLADYPKSPVKGVDGVGGATQGGFYAKSLSYAISGQAYGTYKLKLEYTCRDGQGPFETIQFNWSGAAIDTTVNFSYFKNVHLVYAP